MRQSIDALNEFGNLTPARLPVLTAAPANESIVIVVWPPSDIGNLVDFGVGAFAGEVTPLGCCPEVIDLSLVPLAEERVECRALVPS